jgi:hypothetical protein
MVRVDWPRIFAPLIRVAVTEICVVPGFLVVSRMAPGMSVKASFFTKASSTFH